MQGDNIVLHMRREKKAGEWERLLVPLQIRSSGHDLGTKHPQADVAVMYISVPRDVAIPLVTTNLLADDKTLQEFEIHPGDEVNCLGFPLGAESNDAGFPVLRSGKI